MSIWSQLSIVDMQVNYKSQLVDMKVNYLVDMKVNYLVDMQVNYLVDMKVNYLAWKSTI